MTEQEQILNLKGRLFDITEALASARTQNEQFIQILSEIATAVGVTGDEAGNITLGEISKAVKALLPVQEEIPTE